MKKSFRLNVRPSIFLYFLFAVGKPTINEKNPSA